MSKAVMERLGKKTAPEGHQNHAQSGAAPKKWLKSKLGALTTKIGSGATPSGGSESYKETGISLIRSMNVYDDGFYYPKLAKINDKQAELLSNVQVELGDVLLNITGASIARCCVVPDDVLPARVNQHVAIIRPIKGKIDSAFLQYLLCSHDYKNRLLGIGDEGGSTRQALTKAQIQNFEIEYPESIAEQHRIVRLLDQAFEAITAAKVSAEKNLHNARALFEGHLQSVFRQRGNGWVETTLKEVLTNQPQNGWSPPAANHSDIGTPVLTLSSVTGFNFRSEKIKYTSAKTDLNRHYWVKNGDFLITRSNTPELVGHVAIVQGITKPTIYPDLIMRMNPSEDRILTRFLYFQLRSQSMRKEITGRAQGANPTMKKISKNAVQSLPIITAPLTKQKEVVKYLDNILEETTRLESSYQRKLIALDALKKSLLHQAFSGNI